MATKATKRGNFMGDVGTLNKTAWNILINVSLYNTNKELSNYLGLNKGYVSRLITDLINLRLLRLTKCYNTKVLERTKNGNDAVAYFLAVSKAKKTTNLPLRSHDIWWSIPILRVPENLYKQLVEEGWAEANPNNWNQYRKYWEEPPAMILWATKQIQVILYAYFSANPEEHIVKGLEKINGIILALEKKYDGLVLGKPQVTMAKLKKQSIARQFDPLSLEFWKTSKKYGKKVTYFGENIDVDFSDIAPEVDLKNKVLSPSQCHDLAEFFDRWVEDPVYPQDLRDSNQSIRKEVSVIKEAVAKLICVIDPDAPVRLNYTKQEKQSRNEEDKPSYLG